ncbi:MAG: CRISPR system precrRNA processing endoribonuclease RAMP protein Cas6 [Halobacteria archaeon]
MPRAIQVEARPDRTYHIPYSDGYLVYSSLLENISTSDEDVSSHVHDTDFSSISVSSLSGNFKRSDRDGRKKIEPNESYRFQIGVTDPEEHEIYQSIVEPLVLENRDVEVGDSKLELQEFRSQEKGFEEILDGAKEYDDPTIDMKFESPTCIKYGGSEVTEMFPHRTAVFGSILGKWNAAAPEELEIDLDRREIGGNLIEKPELRSLRTHSVRVNTVYDDEKGHERPIVRQGFTGRCRYEFVGGVGEDLEKAVTALAIFGEYSGVGSAVARGCGSVEVRT